MKKEEGKMAPGQALEEIRDMMNRSTRSYLCGWSPLLCGLVALAGGLLVRRLIGSADAHAYDSGFPIAPVCIVAVVTLALGVLVPFVFSLIRAGKNGIALSFNANNRRLFVTLFLPVFIGGMMSIAMCFAKTGMYEWIPAVMLCFYGLAVTNLSKCSEPSLEWPGLILILIGLTACFLRRYALELWILGFGAVHVVYGVYLIFKSRG
ncbi:MAG: hypothetical protein MJZ06_00550 [Bacteroidaceae bacterium]|nr:hypothetical protein [Bacteroidaceae bacterium]